MSQTPQKKETSAAHISQLLDMKEHYPDIAGNLQSIIVHISRNLPNCTSKPKGPAYYNEFIKRFEVRANTGNNQKAIHEH
ncbi:hypothetical protein [Flagellimonas marina]|uniref:Uncharacterized protein n=1 Tax=Flagellimonas marina TaxID=1775168 RepID=A0ABV8PGC8_9FLAO